ncbi:MAG: nodulation protein NfeD, partial [Alistipes ihumii]
MGLIDNQAASAGALIALAADSIYMRPGASIGAASVVDQSGRPMPDKFQSFMRATMRATAESHGKVIERIDGGDTVWRWHRDPLVAEAMVGRSAGDSTTLRVLTLTADEAVQRHFSEGSASSVAEVLQRAGVEDYTLYVYEPTTLDRVLGWLMNPVAQGIFIMLIIGG